MANGYLISLNISAKYVLRSDWWTPRCWSSWSGMIIEKNVNGQEPAWQPAWQHHKECNIDDYFVLRKLFWLASTLAYSPLAAIAMQIVLFLISKLLFNHQLSLKPKLSQHHNWHMLCLLCGLTPAKWGAGLTTSATQSSL